MFQGKAAQNSKVVDVPENPEDAPGKGTGSFQVLWDSWGNPRFSCYSLDAGK